eukprot:gene24958-10616_t
MTSEEAVQDVWSHILLVNHLPSAFDCDPDCGVYLQRISKWSDSYLQQTSPGLPACRYVEDTVTQRLLTSGCPWEGILSRSASAATSATPPVTSATRPATSATHPSTLATLDGRTQLFCMPSESVTQPSGSVTQASESVTQPSESVSMTPESVSRMLLHAWRLYGLLPSSTLEDAESLVDGQACAYGASISHKACETLLALHQALQPAHPSMMHHLSLLAASNGFTELAVKALADSCPTEQAVKALADLGLAEQALKALADSGFTEQALKALADSGLTEQAVKALADLGLTEQALKALADLGLTEQALKALADLGLTEQALKALADLGLTEQAVKALADLGFAEQSVKALAELGFAEQSVKALADPVKPLSLTSYQGCPHWEVDDSWCVDRWPATSVRKYIDVALAILFCQAGDFRRAVFFSAATADYTMNSKIPEKLQAMYGAWSSLCEKLAGPGDVVRLAGGNKLKDLSPWHAHVLVQSFQRNGLAAQAIHLLLHKDLCSPDGDVMQDLILQTLNDTLDHQAVVNLGTQGARQIIYQLLANYPTGFSSSLLAPLLRSFTDHKTTGHESSMLDLAVELYFTGREFSGQYQAVGQSVQLLGSLLEGMIVNPCCSSAHIQSLLGKEAQGRGSKGKLTGGFQFCQPGRDLILKGMLDEAVMLADILVSTQTRVHTEDASFLYRAVSSVADVHQEMKLASVGGSLADPGRSLADLVREAEGIMMKDLDIGDTRSAGGPWKTLLVAVWRRRVGGNPVPHGEQDFHAKVGGAHDGAVGLERSVAGGQQAAVPEVVTVCAK